MKRSDPTETRRTRRERSRRIERLRRGRRSRRCSIGRRLVVVLGGRPRTGAKNTARSAPTRSPWRSPIWRVLLRASALSPTKAPPARRHARVRAAERLRVVRDAHADPSSSARAPTAAAAGSRRPGRSFSSPFAWRRSRSPRARRPTRRGSGNSRGCFSSPSRGQDFRRAPTTGSPGTRPETVGCVSVASVPGSDPRAARGPSALRPPRLLRLTPSRTSYARTTSSGTPATPRRSPPCVRSPARPDRARTRWISSRASRRNRAGSSRRLSPKPVLWSVEVSAT